jgi:hypothetical protein
VIGKSKKSLGHAHPIPKKDVLAQYDIERIDVDGKILERFFLIYLMMVQAEVESLKCLFRT